MLRLHKPGLSAELPFAVRYTNVSYADVAAFCDTFPNDRLQTTQHSSRLYHRKLAKQIQQS